MLEIANILIHYFNKIQFIQLNILLYLVKLVFGYFQIEMNA